MKERPILLNTEMVNATLDGRKNQTRRVLRYQPNLAWSKKPIWVDSQGYYHSGKDSFLGTKSDMKCPYGKAGDLLYVRETWALWLNDEGPEGHTRLIKFKDDSIIIIPKEDNEWWDEKEKRGYLNRPSIHLPKRFTRLWLKIKNIRVERIQDISEEDAKNEGIYKDEHGWYKNYVLGNKSFWHHRWKNVVDGEGSLVKYYGEFLSTKSAKTSFATLWDSINGKPRKDGKDISWNSNPYVWVVEFERIEK